jgi:hypothetical protein
MRFCQSCLQRLNTEEEHGTNADGSKNEDYCIFCYQNGAFVSPDVTMDQMIDYRAKEMVNMIIDPENGRKLLREWFSGLKRWRTDM